MQPTDITANTNHTAVQQFYGISVREDAGSPDVAAFNVRKASAGGATIMVVNLAANESATLFVPRPVVCEDGVYIEVTEGTISGVILGT